MTRRRPLTSRQLDHRPGIDCLARELELHPAAAVRVTGRAWQCTASTLIRHTLPAYVAIGEISLLTFGAQYP